MNKSSFELYHRDQIGKLNINWQGLEPNEPPFIDRIIKAIEQIQKLVIVVNCNPNTLQTCMRMLFSLSRHLETLGVENSVVFEVKQMSDAAEMTGFSNFFSVFPSEEKAAMAMGIIDLYPLILIENYAGTPDPIVA